MMRRIANSRVSKTIVYSGFLVALVLYFDRLASYPLGITVADLPMPRTTIEWGYQQGETNAAFEQKYRFTSDWHSRFVPEWRQALEELEGLPDLRYLEIGLFQGRSALWMAENILTHPTASITGIDPFLDESSEQVFRENLATFEIDRPGVFEVIKGFSQDELQKLEPSSFDIAYIDGSHTADDVLADAVMTWELLAPGGILIFDDYEWRTYLPSELRPTVAIDAFLTTYRYRYELIHRSYQVIIRKAESSACQSKLHCSAVGKFAYDWSKKELVDSHSGKIVELSPKQHELLRRLLVSRRFGADQKTFYGRDLGWTRHWGEFKALLELLEIEPSSM